MEKVVDHARLISNQVLAPDLVRAVFSGAQRGRQPPWVKVSLRPVDLRGGRHLQFSYFDGKKDIARNYQGEAAAQELANLLTVGFRNYHVLTATDELQVNLSSKGKPVISRRKVSAPVAIDRTHNHRKHLPLPEGTPDVFLQAIGIMTPEGQVRPSLYDKFRQINEFLKIVAQALPAAPEDGRPLSLMDLGCGSAHLTFAAYHHLNHVLGIRTRLVGIDRNAELAQRNRQLAETLGWQDISFEVGNIIDYQAVEPIDLVFALHACNTATDEALAQALRSRARLIFCAPCCHHQLQQQLDRQPPVTPFQPVLRHGILKERLGDVLTDAFRATILRILGYTTDVFEFVSPEHTSKNLMIRAVRSVSAGDPRFVREYADLKRFWGVTPYLEELLEPETRQTVNGGPCAENNREMESGGTQS